MKQHANRNGYKVEYAKENYYRIEITVPKNAKPAIIAAATAAGEKPVEFVKNALMQRLKIESWDEITTENE